jgi:hypothetical protein
MRTSSRILPLALALGLALAAAGCGSKSGPSPTQAKSAAPVKKVATPADSLSPYLVSAATTGKSGAAMLRVKFELGGRPEVGDPVDVDLVLVPAADNIDRVSGTVQADEGLEVVSGASISPQEKPAFGTPIHHGLKVRAKRDGIFTLSAAMTIESGGQTLGPVYSMPLIAGNGLVDTGATPVPAQRAAKPAASAAAK